MYYQRSRVLQNVVIFVRERQVRSGYSFVVVCDLLHTLVVQRLYLKQEVVFKMYRISRIINALNRWISM